MPRAKKKCGIEGCDTLTNGKLCKPHDNERRRSPINPREYRRNWHMRNKYDLSPDEFDAMWIAFRGQCGICSIDLKLPTNTRGQALDIVAIDHDHTTGNVRGLLCNGCNKGLGLFRDSSDNLKRAISWLEM